MVVQTQTLSFAKPPAGSQCAAPQTTLLLVVTSLDNLNPGQWLWVKSGKQAGH